MIEGFVEYLLLTNIIVVIIIVITSQVINVHFVNDAACRQMNA